MDTRSPAKFLETVISEHYRVLRNLALRLTKDSEEARDLLQDTFLKILRFSSRFEEGTNVRAWACTIMRNTWLNKRSAKARRGACVDFEKIAPFLAAPEECPDDYASMEEAANGMNGHMRDALNELPRIYRQAVLLADLGDYSYEEIATLTGSPISTVGVRVLRGRRHLRKSLAAYAREEYGYGKG